MLRKAPHQLDQHAARLIPPAEAVHQPCRAQPVGDRVGIIGKATQEFLGQRGVIRPGDAQRLLKYLAGLQMRHQSRRVTGPPPWDLVLP